MPFETLAKKFEQQSQEIYNRFLPSTDQLISIKPDTKNPSQFTVRDAAKALTQLKLPSGTGVLTSDSRVKNDNRSVPVVSTARDAVRVFKFLESPEGNLFIGKQFLLQTGNTFQNTRIYNPVSTLASTIPFLHIKRSLSPTLGIVPSVSGLLQTNTVTDISSKFIIVNAVNASFGGREKLFSTVKSIASTYIKSQLKQIAGPFIPQTYSSSRPEFKVFTDDTGPVVFDPQPLVSRGVVRVNNIANVRTQGISRTRSALLKTGKAALDKLIPKSLRGVVQTDGPTLPEKIPTFLESAKEFKDGFYNGRGTVQGETRFNSKYFNERLTVTEQTDNPQTSVTKGKTLLSDPYNIAPFIESPPRGVDATTGNIVTDKLSYANISKPQPVKSDIIKFIFKDANGSNPVHFRALISSIKESIKPEFNDQRYVGRTERFVTYGGAKRGVNMSFNIVAFSPNELDGMWTKINYLTGLAFPKNVKNGFMIPPLFTITVGEIYDVQPCYIESLDYDFLDDSITFDIDREVPFAINVTMQLSILEKRSKFHDSPFYKITEDASELAKRREAGVRRILDIEMGRRGRALS